MKKYLEWGDVQRQLTARVARGEEPCGFLQGIKDLWEQGVYHEAEELPKVSFDRWDCEDLDELERLLDSTPVDVTRFETGLKDSKPVARTGKRFLHALSIEGVPIRIAVDQAMGLHAHSVFRMVYIAKGRGTLVTEDSSCALEEHTVCILSPGFYHDAVAEEGCIMLSIAMTDDTLEETLYRVLEPENVLSDFFRGGLGGNLGGCLLLRPRDPAHILSIFRRLLHEGYTKEEYSKNIYISMLQILFAVLLRDSTGYELERPRSRGRTAIPMLTVLKYIQAHYHETSLEEVAERFHYSPSHLSKQLKAATGRSYVELVRDLRIREAKLLLADTDLPMDQVAEQAGFDSRVHFYRTFRSCTGMTPGDWRRQSGGGR